MPDRFFGLPEFLFFFLDPELFLPFFAASGLPPRPFFLSLAAPSFSGLKLRIAQPFLLSENHV